MAKKLAFRKFLQNTPRLTSKTHVQSAAGRYQSYCSKKHLQIPEKVHRLCEHSPPSVGKHGTRVSWACAVGAVPCLVKVVSVQLVEVQRYTVAKDYAKPGKQQMAGEKLVSDDASSISTNRN